MSLEAGFQRLQYLERKFRRERDARRQQADRKRKADKAAKGLQEWSRQVSEQGRARMPYAD